MTNEFVARVTENLSNSHGTADVVQIGVGLSTVPILNFGFGIEDGFFQFVVGCYAYLKSKLSQVNPFVGVINLKSKIVSPILNQFSTLW